MTALPDEEQRSFLIKMREGNIFEQRESIHKKLQALTDEHYVYVNAQESSFDGHFEEARGIRNIMLFTAATAIILASMGLYGLVSINVSSNLKDFGIRKVLGASRYQLSQVVMRRFKYILGVAILLGASLSVLLVGTLLESVYSYSAQIGVGPLAIASVILLMVAIITLNMKIQQVRRLNPADTLRTE